MDQALVPVLTFVISVASIVWTQVQANRAKDRERRIDDRAAAKDTVDTLASLNEALGREIDGLRSRMESLEQKFDNCEQERGLLLVERDTLRVQLTEARRT